MIILKKNKFKEIERQLVTEEKVRTTLTGSVIRAKN